MSLKLEKLLSIIEAQNNQDMIFNYTIPDTWNCFGYNGRELKQTYNGELIINPYNFYSCLIKDYLLPKKANKNYNKSLAQANSEVGQPESFGGGDWIKKSTLYSTMIRTSSTWDSDRSGHLESSNIYHLKETGTFIKTLAYLPTLKKMGVDVVYMLPISKFSLKDKKGELGSPYGVSNFFELDPSLKDPITLDEMSIEEEFQAFIEACHILDMKVMIDIIPRTNSVNSDFIATNPDWFYWIGLDDLAGYYPPHVPGVGTTVSPKEHHLKQVYQSKDVWNHINKFKENPSQLDPGKWDYVVSLWNQNKELNILDLVREHFNMTVAPAFSDHINDTQPPWTDVTFFRMFLDHPQASKPYLGDNNPAPYILFDSIKSNLFEGQHPNQSLWDTLANIIPYYQTTFGIDGARIDMGHALPFTLTQKIINTARAIDPDFCFIAEELDPERAYFAKEAGYNMIIGKGFYNEPRYNEHLTQSFIYDSRWLPCPVFAGGETHDTPRLAARNGGHTLSKMLTIVNMFMPNGVPFINSGQELYETQPMNTGLDCRDNEQYSLFHDDPYNGKLALFDKYQLHYNNPVRWDLIDTLDYVSQIRKRYLDQLVDVARFRPLGFNNMSDDGIGLGYIIDEDNTKKMLVVIANTNPHEHKHLTCHIGDLRYEINNYNYTAEILYGSHDTRWHINDFDHNGNFAMWFAPGEVKVIKI